MRRRRLGAAGLIAVCVCVCDTGPGAGKTTVMAMRAMYIIGCLKQGQLVSLAYDGVVALTFSRRYVELQLVQQSLACSC